MEKKQIIKNILCYVGITYVISGVGYAFWLQTADGESPAAFLPILAPFIGAVYIYLRSGKKIDLMINKVSWKGLLIGFLFPVIYLAISALIYQVIGNSFMPLHLTTQMVITLLVQWIFDGFCEELGWRCILLPLLKKTMRLSYACVLTGVIWAIWHFPMILGGLMVTGQVKGVAILMFLIEVIAMSFIFGIFSECKFGKNVWTYVVFHMTHNIIVVNLLKMIDKSGYKYLDDGGFIITSMIVLFAVIVWMSRKTIISKNV